MILQLLQLLQLQLLLRQLQLHIQVLRHWLQGSLDVDLRQSKNGAATPKGVSTGAKQTCLITCLYKKNVFEFNITNEMTTY